ncbi:hypothetical protein O9Z70_10095 [Devosia sp. YIM 151766]|uniref:hypothetical protein n=1 Tax=Devosia sp. YIM 151766 TaxID=3017325 RepID=UPI00255CE0C0|nr:hypothetical protein [Devosia sp. YIM 151766]WIY51835.1 hypothetical protein O9Z70_10095 [Devosia sp. YIM 151766]
MHISTSPSRKKIGLAALFGILVLASAVMALIAGVTPAKAANIASQPDTQVAIFMIPLTLLVLVLLFEAARFVRRGALPAQLADRPSRRLRWSPDQPGG